MTTAYQSACLRGLAPDPLQTLDEWAEEHFIVPKWSSEPGPIRLDRTPFLREILRELSPISPVQRVVFMKPGQIGATTCGQIWIGATIARYPAPMLVVEPTVDLAKKLSRQRINPLLRECPVLHGKVAEAKSRDAANTILAKEFEGGMLVLTGANSGPGLRFMSAKHLFLDEVDAYPFDVDGEGAPVEVAEKRTDSYSFPKIYLASTPLISQTSVIAKEYEASDQRVYTVPCPHCGTYQVLVWKQLKWPKDKPEQAEYECEACSRMIQEYHKGDMLNAGEWRAQNPSVTDVAGFHLNALYTPYGWRNSWAALAKRWTAVIRKRDRGQHQAFVNLNLAETWTDDETAVEQSTLYQRREVYSAEVPDGVLVLTASVDVQRDRIEAECVGWGIGEEGWSVEKVVFYGSVANQGVWDSLDQWRTKSWTHAGGFAAKLSIMVVDSSDQTKEVYAYVKPRQGERVYAVKGSSEHGVPLVGKKPSRNNLARVLLFSIGTNAAKDTLFARLKLDQPGPGFMHFPALETHDEEYFAQLTAESRVPKYDRGVLVGYTYKKNRARNEELDLWVYNMAALAILNPNWKAKEAARAKAQADPASATNPAPQSPEPKAPFVRPATTWPRGKGGFTTGWRR